MGLLAQPVAAQIEKVPLTRITGLDASEEELAAWKLVEARRHIKAREQAEAILKERPRSFVAHLVLGFVHHYGEADFPRALYHLKLAEQLFERRFGHRGGADTSWRWHAQLLRELAWAHGDLEHHAKKLEYIAKYNSLYEPDMIAERAWPLMKLGRFEEARLSARLGLATDIQSQRSTAYNALCAIEFEAGNDGSSYEACKRAVDASQDGLGPASAVDLTNLAEAARSLFRLDEAERASREATEARLAYYGNPWMELAELYTREGRFGEALGALREVPRYRARRPPYARNADRNESRRALAAFLLLAGRADAAARITSKALVAPDRRAHNSRDPAQDRVIVALLGRLARRMQASLRLEAASIEPVYKRPLAWLTAAWLRFEGWRSGALAARLLSDNARLVGTFQIGSAKSAVAPPWLVGEIIRIVGPGVASEALRLARKQDKRPPANAYYDAFLAEAALEMGEHERALDLASKALDGLPRAEKLLRARTQALAAHSAWERGLSERARGYYDGACQSDPGVFRRLELALPARFVVRGGGLAERAAELLARSPRLRSEDNGLAVHVQGDGSGGQVCLAASHGAVLGCARVRADGKSDADALARSLVERFHAEVFAPRVDLAQTDIHSLDGSTAVGRDMFQVLFDLE